MVLRSKHPHIPTQQSYLHSCGLYYSSYSCHASQGMLTIKGDMKITLCNFRLVSLSIYCLVITISTLAMWQWVYSQSYLS